MNMLFVNAHIIDPATGRDCLGQLLVEGGKIAKIADVIEPGDAHVIDLGGKVLAPGLVDIHCHLRDPGLEYKEDIASGTMAAAAGGFTTVCCMANTDPVNDCAAVTYAITGKAAREGVVHVRPIGAITKGLKGQELAEIGEMKLAGAVAVSDDGQPVSNPRLMYNALRYASAFDMPVVAHCEDKALVGGGVMNQGFSATLLGLKGIPRSAEEAAIARDILIAEELGARLHICHVSTKGGAELVRQAKARGVRVTAETAPHYITLTDMAVDGYDGNARVNPPLREQSDIDALIAALCDGTIDAIATDHAPHHADEKSVEFDMAASGFSGLETAFSLCYGALVKPGHMTLSGLIDKMSAAPAKVLGLNAGTLTVGADADFTVIDPEATWTVDPKRFKSKGKNTPFAGWELKGRITHTCVGGELVYYLEEEKS